MNDHTLYFAYGSNMARERMKARVPSAQFLFVASLPGYTLKFHKPGKIDGTGKCDAAFTGKSNDRVLGALYSIRTSQLPELDRIEGLGHGYARKTCIGEHVVWRVIQGRNVHCHDLRPEPAPARLVQGARSAGSPGHRASIRLRCNDRGCRGRRRSRQSEASKGVIDLPLNQKVRLVLAIFMLRFVGRLQ